MRNKKIEKELTNFITDGNNVSDSALDLALQAMPVSKPKQKSHIYKWAMAVVPSLVLIIVVTVVIITLNNGYREEEDSGRYNYEDLIAENIESIEIYNKQNNTNYLWLNDLEITASKQLSNKYNEVVLIEQINNYKDLIITEYISNQLISIDIIRDIEVNDRINVNGTSCSYIFVSNKCYSKIYIDDYIYLIVIESKDDVSPNNNDLTEILTLLLENR